MDGSRRTYRRCLVHPRAPVLRLGIMTLTYALVAYGFAAFCVGVPVWAAVRCGALADERSNQGSNDLPDADEAAIRSWERVYAGTPSNTKNSVAGGMGR